MTTYKSTQKTISSNEEVVFSILSDFRNLEKFKQKIEESGKAKDIEFTEDSCTFIADMVGRVTFQIVERTPFSLVRFKLNNALINAEANIRLEKVTENDTNLWLGLDANLPPMVKMMLGKKIDEGIEKMADGLSFILNNLNSDTKTA